MIMHITFKDGSNPYMSFNRSAQWIKSKYRDFANANGKQTFFPLKSNVIVKSSAIDGLTLRQMGSGCYAVFKKNKYGFEQQISNEYYYFGAAVNRLGKESAKLQMEACKK